MITKTVFESKLKAHMSNVQMTKSLSVGTLYGGKQEIKPDELAAYWNLT